MPDTAAPVTKAPNRWKRRAQLSSMTITLVPLAAAYTCFFDSSESTPAERAWAGTAWLTVWACSLLATYAAYRIRINMRYNRRPFTPKDRKFCYLAAYVSTGAAGSLVTVGLFKAPDAHTQTIGVADLVSAQAVTCLVLSGVLFLLGDVHGRGAAMDEELGRGV